MSEHTCPWWLGYLLVSPVRRWLEDPEACLSPHVRDGMRVLEPGPGMGYFTLEIARLVGPGRVVAVDLQERMIRSLRRRAERAGLSDRVETLVRPPGGLGVDNLAGTFDFAVVIHMLHEVGDQQGFLRAVHGALKPGGMLLIIEPPGHVSAAAFKGYMDLAAGVGFTVAEPPQGRKLRALLRRGAPSEICTSEGHAPSCPGR